MIRIIGIGSPFGDDAAGLAVAAALAPTASSGVEVVAADRPGIGLIDLLDGIDAAILIDAVRCGATPGTVHDLDGRAILAQPEMLRSGTSSHGFGVIEALQLAQALGRVPGRLRILGIEADTADPTAPALSAAVRRAVADVVERVEIWTEHFRSHVAFDRPRIDP